MMKHTQKTGTIIVQIVSAVFILLTAAFFLFSFTIKTITGDFLKQLGITKAEADEKIINSILGGSLDQYGVGNAKNIAVGNRAAVTKDLLTYTKTYVSSTAFIKAYNELRQKQKPAPHIMQTPEDMQKEYIARSKQAVADMEASAQKADASLKPMLEKMVVDAKKQLKEAEDPNNKMIANYRKIYPQAVKDTEINNERLLAGWEAKYPSNHLLYVKMRMQQFLEETKDIDFNAQLIEKTAKNILSTNRMKAKATDGKWHFVPEKNPLKQPDILFSNG